MTPQQLNCRFTNVDEQLTGLYNEVMGLAASYAKGEVQGNEVFLCLLGLAGRSADARLLMLSLQLDCLPPLPPKEPWQGGSPPP